MKKKFENRQQNKFQPYIFYVIFLVVLGSTATAFYFLGSSKSADADPLKFSLLNPARAFISQKDLIVNFQPLRDYLNDKYESDQSVSIYFEYLPTGSNIAISKDAEFYPASLLKVPVAMAAAKKIDKGDWEWSSKLVLMSGDKDDKFGSLYKEQTGSLYTIEDLVKRSMVDSDNTAHFMLLRNLELSEINDVYAHMGLDGFLETNGNISAKRYAVVLRALYNSSYLSEGSSQKIILFLSEEPFRDYLGSGLPDDAIFAHKIGVDIDRKIYLDSGIIYYRNRPYSLTVMTKTKTEQQAKAIMKDVSEKVFNYVKNYNE